MPAKRRKLKAPSGQYSAIRPTRSALNAPEAGIPAQALTADRFDSRDAFDRELIRKIDAYAPDVVVLAGFMRILSPMFVAHYYGRLLNIHPSLLPKYPGCIPIAGRWKTAMRSTVPRYIS